MPEFIRSIPTFFCCFFCCSTSNRFVSSNFVTIVCSPHLHRCQAHNRCLAAQKYTFNERQRQNHCYQHFSSHTKNGTNEKKKGNSPPDLPALCLQQKLHTQYWIVPQTQLLLFTWQNMECLFVENCAICVTMNAIGSFSFTPCCGGSWWYVFPIYLPPFALFSERFESVLCSVRVFCDFNLLSKTQKYWMKIMRYRQKTIPIGTCIDWIQSDGFGFDERRGWTHEDTDFLLIITIILWLSAVKLLIAISVDLCGTHFIKDCG